MTEETIHVGGQAVIEGVMMRTPGALAVAVRRPNGDITVKTEQIIAPSERPRVLRLPIIRGVLNLFQAIRLGVQSLNYSANQSLDEDDTPLGPMALGLTIAFAFAMAIVLFVYAPLLLTNLLKRAIPVLGHSTVLFNLVDGVIRIVFFLLYICGISLIKDLRRVFEYHGAEHKTIYTYEHGEELTPDHADKYSTLHPRCGTNFLLIVMLISILAFSVLRSDAPFYMKFLSRIVFIPLIAGVSYEIIRFAGRKQDIPWVQWISKPGLYLQKITTKPPSHDQLNVAIRALQEAVRLERARPSKAQDSSEVIL
jgi:uncharacterized protein YqhQ